MKGLLSLSRPTVLALAALACLSAPVRSQDRPGLRFAVVAVESGDKDAFAAARRWFSDAKTDMNRKTALAKLAEKGEAPPVPTEIEEKPATRTNDKAELALSAAALAPLDLGALLAGAALSAKPAKDMVIPAVTRKLPHEYRWVRLSDAEAKSLRLDAVDAVTKARQAGEPVVLPGHKFLLWGRAGKAPMGPAENFVLVREEPRDKVVTEAALERVSALPGDVSPSLGIRLSKDGSDRFKAFTTAHKPGSQVALVLGDRVARIVRLEEAIDDGVFYLGGLRPEEVHDLAAQLQGLVRPK
jgi:hypothetical protein